jgi:hypothetical protein
MIRVNFFPFTILLLNETFPTVSGVTQIEIECKTYASRILTYELSTLRFTKLWVFHIIWSYLGYIVAKGMV